MAQTLSKHAEQGNCNKTESFGPQTYLRNDTLLSMARQFGTPIYAYDGSHVINMYNSIRDFIKWPKLKVFYAMKANSNKHLIDLLKGQGANFDTVSLGEAYQLYQQGVPRDKILNTANNITAEEMAKVRYMGILMNIGETSLLEKYGRIFPNTEVCVRINPEVIAGEFAMIQTAGVLSKFGILEEDIPKVKAIASEHGLRIVGLHCHTGSGIADTAKYFESMRKLGSLALPENFPELQFIDYGGGFKVPYRPDEHRIDYPEFGKEMTNIFSGICDRYGKELGLYFEPGKYIVAEAGYFLIEVNTIRNNRGRMIVGTNSGFSQLIRPVLYDAYHEIVNASNPDGPMAKYDIGGNICEGGDFFAKDRLIAEVHEGDILVLKSAGAYCYSMASEYNSRPLPLEVTLVNNVPVGIHLRETETERVDRILRDSVEA